jgi:hypothetical protein
MSEYLTILTKSYQNEHFLDPQKHPKTHKITHIYPILLHCPMISTYTQMYKSAILVLQNLHSNLGVKYTVLGTIVTSSHQEV